jgi:hypothetical protein
VTVFWRDQEVAARVRLHMPDESTIDLDEHAAQIGKTVAGAELARIQTAEGRVALHALERQVASSFGARP